MKRAIAALALLTLSCLAGCSSHCLKHVGRTPPAFKVCNGSRLSNEVQWFYADIQDVVFGVEYYQDMEDLYGAGPYASNR